MIYFISFHCIILLPFQIKYLVRNHQPQCLLPLWHHQSPFVLLSQSFFWGLWELLFYPRNRQNHLFLLIILDNCFIKNIVCLLCSNSPLFIFFSFPIMYGFCSSAIISGLSSNQVFTGYLPQFYLKLSGGHGAVSNYVILSILFSLIPIFCSATK